MSAENPKIDIESFELPELSKKGALKVFEEAVRLLNLVRTADRITPSETVEDGNYRKRWFEESFHLKVSDLEEIFPGGNWEQRVREEASRRFPEK